MGRKDAFLAGFIKRASFLNSVKRYAVTAAVAGGAGYGGAKLFKATEDPEQARMRALRKQGLLPFQNGASE